MNTSIRVQSESKVKKVIYVHFLDIYHYLRARSNKVSFGRMLQEGRLAFRLAFLFSDEIVIPASSYFESNLARRVLHEHDDLVRMGFVYLTAGDSNLEAHREAKRKQYGNFSPPYLVDLYDHRLKVSPPPYIQKRGSSLEEIKSNWLRILSDDELGSYIKQFSWSRAPSARILERAWERVPDELGDRAFVTDHAHSLLEAFGLPDVPRSLISVVIELPYVTGYVKSLGAGLVCDLVYLRSPFDIQITSWKLSYRALCESFAALGLLRLIRDVEEDGLVAVRTWSDWKTLSRIVNEGQGLKPKTYELARRILQLAHNLRLGQHKKGQNRIMLRQPNPPVFPARVGIVTALSLEFVPMRYLIDNRKPWVAPAGDPNRYVVGYIPQLESSTAPAKTGAQRKLPVVLTRLKRMGTNSAAAAATNLLRSFPNVDVVVMTGIACAAPSPQEPDKHVRLGDVVISDRKGVVQFDYVSRADGKTRPKDALPPPSARMTDAMNDLEVEELEQDYNWYGYIEAVLSRYPHFGPPPADSDVLEDASGVPIEHPHDPSRIPGRPRVFRGIIGSSNTLLRDAEFRDQLRDTYDLRAIEMESSGISEAAWSFDQSYVVIRGTCDYGDKTKKDKWQKYAAVIAAAYTRALLEFYRPPSMVDVS